MTSNMNAFYAVEPLWFPAFKNVHSMFLDILDLPMVEVLTAANKLFVEYGCWWLEYKGEVYRFNLDNGHRQKSITLYNEQPQAEIIHTIWNTFKEPMVLAQQCYAIAVFHECSDDFLAMKELVIPQHQQKIVKRFYEDFHALHALVAIRGLNE